jgi:hypothetical protein
MLFQARVTSIRMMKVLAQRRSWQIKAFAMRAANYAKAVTPRRFVHKYEKTQSMNENLGRMLWKAKKGWLILAEAKPLLTIQARRRLRCQIQVRVMLKKLPAKSYSFGGQGLNLCAAACAC